MTHLWSWAWKARVIELGSPFVADRGSSAGAKRPVDGGCRRGGDAVAVRSADVFSWGHFRFGHLFGTLRGKQLADGSSGLDAVNDLLNTFEMPVIFITAYPERFLTGERPEPAFLISKPYQPATVSALVSQALFFERNAIQRKRRAS
jgi:hypothetical protein